MSKDTKKLPTFRGRFGTRSKRRKATAKWDRWRFPRGIDISFKRGDNIRPRIGYRTNKKIRGLHPTGRTEIYIRNLQELKTRKDEKNAIFRIASVIGKKKLKEINEFAEKHKLKLANLSFLSFEKERNLKVTKERKRRI